jgi:molybdopterin converting factor subunit 1
MTIVVLYFAALRELLGTSEEKLSGLPGSLTIGALAAQLAERHPALSPHLGSVRFALNESFVDLGAQVTEGDTVALIPPVSGG